MATEEQREQAASASSGETSPSHTQKTNTSPTKSDSVELILTNKAYLKVVMHGLRYPHATVNGVFVGKKSESKGTNGRKVQTIVNAIPLFHSGHGLTPMVEVALTQISDYLSKFTDLAICGYYQINENFHEYPVPVPSVFAEKIAERIYENNPDSVLFMISNYELSKAIDEEDNLQKPFFLYRYSSSGKWTLKDSRSEETFRVEDSSSLCESVQQIVFKRRLHLTLIDFDQHLESPKADWLNLNIDSALDVFNGQ